MDLSGLEKWERSRLEREARRIGVWAPHEKESAELIRRIRAHHESPVRVAKRLFGRALRFARSFAPALGTGDEEPGPSGSSRAVKEHDEEKHASNDASASASASESTSPSAKLADRTPGRVLPEPTEDDPLPTRTMARLLAEQGHTARANAIYDRLIAERPGDSTLEAERARFASGRQSGKAARSKESGSSDDDEHGEVVFARADDEQVVVAWSVPASLVARANNVLGDRGRATARVVVVSEREGDVCKETFDLHRGFEGQGIVPAPSGARVTASIGVLAGGRFVSIAHAPPEAL